jgi:probable HAF family extracellular repeat protein
VKRSIVGVVIVLSFVAVGIAAAPPLTFTFLDVHSTKTATETDSYGVNNAGVIAGDYVDSAGVQHAMVLAGTKVTTLNHPNCATSGGSAAGAIAFYGINTVGAVVGWCANTKTGQANAFMYANGKFTAINFPKSTGTEATGINDKGEIVGLYFDSAGAQHGFSKIGTAYKSIDVTGHTSAAAWGVNNAGQITVYALNSAGTAFDAYLKTGTTLKKISDPKAAGLGTVVHTPNNKGDICGTYYANSGSTETHGFLFHGGKYYDVDDPKGPTLSRNDGLNDSLEMVGRYTPTGKTNSVGFKVTTK